MEFSRLSISAKIGIMSCIYYKAFFMLLLTSCIRRAPETHSMNALQHSLNVETTFPLLIAEIPKPAGYTSVAADTLTFAAWLRNVSLKNDKTVYLFDGTRKRNQKAQYAVVDISVGEKNLQQCADAVMRLRAEYMYSRRAYSSIKFTDNDGGNYFFETPYSRTHFNKYLERVFGMCGSASLSKQLQTVQFENILPGDVFIRGGFPGHAVIVMDVAVNREGKKIFLLAQSYMPAQDIHVLNNPSNPDMSPWYEVGEPGELLTPEYLFKTSELKGWE